MVELCELKLMDQGLECQWPPDIDQHIAQLEFEHSTDEEDNSLFSSMALDPSIISTDSLDMEKLHARCEVNKNDYKLTFEESGQWASGNLTTWGRIQSAEPLDDKSNSLPELNGTPRATATEPQRPSSLLATFVERQPDYEYSELYVGNGRYVDVNDNEIGFVPQSTAALQSADRWRAANRLPAHPPLKPRRTFADFHNTRAPQLDFMAMQHQMPSLCQSSISLDEIMVKVREGTVDDEKLDLSLVSMLQKGGPDSGLGSSASASSGPSHIEDWPSLAILLPKHVVEACSFFKANSRLLTGSNNIERATPRRNEACRTCFSVRRRLHPPIWAQPASTKHVLCDCASSEILERSYCSSRERNSTSNRLKLHAQELSIVGLPIYDAKRMLVERVVEGVAEIARGSSASSLCTAMETLIADGLKDQHPWQMIVTVTKPGPATNNVFSLVKELDASEKSLNSRVSTFFTELLRLRSVDCWVCYVVLKENVLRKLYTDGAFMLQAGTAYRSLLWRLVENLELLTVIEKHTSFNDRCPSRHAHIEASRLPSDSRVPKSSSVPARLCTSPRPHSSNCISHTRSLRRSRIPQLCSRPQRARSSGAASAYSRTSSFASAIDDLDEPGLLPVSRGERLRIMMSRGPLVRCCRVRPRHDRVFQGLMPTSNLAIY
uniref:RUN domain-containing protein n=1 Tax=Parascaris univalens TaxID=6257 RepID=A0A915CB03_PARUN